MSDVQNDTLKRDGVPDIVYPQSIGSFTLLANTDSVVLSPPDIAGGHGIPRFYQGTSDTLNVVYREYPYPEAIVCVKGVGMIRYSNRTGGVSVFVLTTVTLVSFSKP